jgi:hypothetical protein
MNRRDFIRNLLMGTSLIAFGACRPAASIPFVWDSNTLPPPQLFPHGANHLFGKAMGYESQMGRIHLSSEGRVRYAFREDGPQLRTLPDTTIWTGCYVAAEAFRWAVTKDPDAKVRLARSLDALYLLQAVTGKDGLLARTFWKGHFVPSPAAGEWHSGTGDFTDYMWLGDVSADQVNGAFFGYALAFDLLKDPSLRQQITSDVSAIADHLLDHKMKIVDIDGLPTRHGHLGSGPFTEDLNALIALMVMKVAHHVTEAPRFHRAYTHLIEKKKYHFRAAQARDKWWEYLRGINHSDNNLAFLAYYLLIRLEKDPFLKRVYRKGLERTWRVVRPERNPFFTFIHQSFLPKDQRDTIALEQALETLLLFPGIKRDRRVVNSRRHDLCRSFWKDRHGHPQACLPLPIQERPVDSFEWKANPYRLDGGGDGKIIYAGVDFLLPYWMGRYHSFIHSGL